jgi:hypothetical protein
VRRREQTCGSKLVIKTCVPSSSCPPSIVTRSHNIDLVEDKKKKKDTGAGG